MITPRRIAPTWTSAAPCARSESACGWRRQATLADREVLALRARHAARVGGRDPRVGRRVFEINAEGPRLAEVHRALEARRPPGPGAPASGRSSSSRSSPRRSRASPSFTSRATTAGARGHLGRVARAQSPVIAVTGRKALPADKALGEDPMAPSRAGSTPPARSGAASPRRGIVRPGSCPAPVGGLPTSGLGAQRPAPHAGGSTRRPSRQWA